MGNLFSSSNSNSNSNKSAEKELRLLQETKVVRESLVKVIGAGGDVLNKAMNYEDLQNASKALSDQVETAQRDLETNAEYGSRVVDKLNDEIAYFYNPANLLQLVSRGLFPSVGLLKNFEKVVENFMLEIFGLVLQNDEWVESATPIKYVMKQFPLSNQLVQYIPLFAPELAKDLGIKTQSQSGFIK
jgi:hypothetical protein